ncbi:ABC transporter substrate-binding protein [Streptacidiphilus sp. MAP5-3]|uniref:ABC transporter substrate-binding protein n=1 Tax=unclassified Streptacidiphilus TaxID=2643834 RepID=UPI00351115C8
MNALLKTTRLFSTVVGAAVLALAGCAPQSSSSGSGSGASAGASAAAASCTKGALATMTSGKLTIGTDNPAYTPWFDNNDPSDGKGFESAVAYAVAQQLGYDKGKVSWTVAPFNNVVTPGQKKFDFDINEVSVTDERKQAVDFSTGYYDVRQAVITLKGSKFANATTVAGLKGAKIGAQVGTTGLTVVQKVIDPTTQPSVYDTTDLLTSALKDHQIDAFVTDLPTAFYITSAELTNATVTGQFPSGAATSDGKPEQFGLVLPKGSALTSCVSQAVDALQANGTLTTLAKQWLPASDTAPVLK